MNVDNVNKYDVLSTTDVSATSFDFKSMISNIGMTVSYYEYDTVNKIYKSAVTIKGILFSLQNVDEDIIRVVEEGNAIFSTETFNDLNIVPSEKDKIKYSSREFIIRNIFFYGKNDKVPLLKDSIVVSMLLIEKQKFTRNSLTL